ARGRLGPPPCCRQGLNRGVVPASRVGCSKKERRVAGSAHGGWAVVETRGRPLDSARLVGPSGAAHQRLAVVAGHDDAGLHARLHLHGRTSWVFRGRWKGSRLCRGLRRFTQSGEFSTTSGKKQAKKVSLLLYPSGFSLAGPVLTGPCSS